MRIQEVITTINEMQANGIIECYFIESGSMDTSRFQDILTRHQLTGAWRIFERQFLAD